MASTPGRGGEGARTHHEDHGWQQDSQAPVTPGGEAAGVSRQEVTAVPPEGLTSQHQCLASGHGSASSVLCRTYHQAPHQPTPLTPEDLRQSVHAHLTRQRLSRKRVQRELTVAPRPYPTPSSQRHPLGNAGAVVAIGTPPPSSVPPARGPRHKKLSMAALGTTPSPPTATLMYRPQLPRPVVEAQVFAHLPIKK